ncbi:hypothetical protein [Paenibacillus sp. A3]|uniref:hypothetical protein n=1 Tax=Paenibacillus sp. A3 TaxID=1337054 RepID=UPI0009E78ED7|nr:hypothetical protein [Paenibacillus sp. A3]
MLEKVKEDGIVTLNHLVELASYDLSKYNGRDINENGLFVVDLGRWRVNQYDWNAPAQHFWRSVIQAYSNQNYTETIREDIKGPSQEFSNHEM